MPLAKELVKQAYKLGAYPYTTITNFELTRLLLENSDEQYFKNYAQMDLYKMKKMDAYIGINATSNTAELVNVTPANMDLYNRLYVLPVHIKERVKNTKWCILKYPSNSIAQLCNMSLEQFEDFYFKVCNVDYAKMSKAMDNLVALMNKTDKVRIVGKGTDLQFSIKGIPAEKYMGTFNIPDGEVASAPVKNSVNGYITYNTFSRYNGTLFNDIYFEFKDGKIIKATSNDTKTLNKLLDTDNVSRYIGEFALGLNPYINAPTGITLFDEKIAGSFHSTPGNCIDESSNGNISAIHWDLGCIQTKKYGGGEIYFDDVLIRKDGNFVPKNLQALNQENLK